MLFLDVNTNENYFKKFLFFQCLYDFRYYTSLAYIRKKSKPIDLIYVRFCLFFSLSLLSFSVLTFIYSQNYEKKTNN